MVWVGYDDNKPLGSGETGASTALPAWIALMKAAHENKPRAEFPRPPGVVTVSIDPKTGKRAADGAEGAIDEVFLEGTEPTESADPKDDAGGAGEGASPSTTDASTTANSVGPTTANVDAGAAP